MTSTMMDKPQKSGLTKRCRVGNMSRNSETCPHSKYNRNHKMGHFFDHQKGSFKVLTKNTYLYRK